jgi:hypothetical protein
MGLSPLCSLPDSSLSHNCSQPGVNVKNFSSSQVASVCSCQVFQVKKCHKRLEKPEETTSQNASLLENDKFYNIDTLTRLRPRLSGIVTNPQIKVTVWTAAYK